MALDIAKTSVTAMRQNRKLFLHYFSNCSELSKQNSKRRKMNNRIFFLSLLDAPNSGIARSFPAVNETRGGRRLLATLDATVKPCMTPKVVFPSTLLSRSVIFPDRIQGGRTPHDRPCSRRARLGTSTGRFLPGRAGRSRGAITDYSCTCPFPDVRCSTMPEPGGAARHPPNFTFAARPSRRRGSPMAACTIRLRSGRELSRYLRAGRRDLRRPASFAAG